MKLKYPVNYIAITTYFKKGVHNGIDLGWSSAYGGSEQAIYAPADGIVTAVRKDYNQTDATGSSYGNYVKIKHANGLSTLCAHLKYGSVSVNVGDTITEGTQIGIMGRTGRANGNHLHYEVFLNDTKVNPEDYTYVYPTQIVSSNPTATEGLLYYTKEETPPTPPETVDELKRQIQFLEDKISLQTKEIEILKQELSEKENFIFEYNVEETALYEIELYKGEMLYIKEN